MTTVDICRWFKRKSTSIYNNVDLEASHFNEDSNTTEASLTYNNNNNNNNNNNKCDIFFGYRCLPCTQKLVCFASLKWFLIIICILILAQGSTQVYFSRTAHLWKQAYGFSEEMADWLIVGSALFNGIFTIFIIHASIKCHRMIWISASLTLFVVTCLALIIPEYFHPFDIDQDQTFKKYKQSHQLCTATRYPNATEISSLDQTNWTSFLLMVLFQAALGASGILLFVHGMVYIDDHESVEDAILLNGIFLACKQISPYFGTTLTWLAIILQGKAIFATFEWIGLSIVILILAGFVGMFPRFLDENTLIKNSVCSADSLNNKKDLFSFLGRIFCNKIVVLNIISSIFYWSAIINFSSMENIFNKSKFSFPDENIFLDQMDIQLTISFLSPVLICVTILSTAVVISKFNLRAFNLALWNTILPAFLVTLFLVYVFLGCDGSDFLNEGPNAIEGFCKWNCDCGNTLYEPVCVPNLQRVFFSPCYAGCTGRSYTGGVLAYPGLCSMSSCYTEWLSQDMVQMAISALSGTALVCHIIVTLYCVHFSERAYALGVHVMLMTVVGSWPCRAAYKALADISCRITTTTTCRLHSSIPLTRYIITLTIVLLIASAVSGLILTVAIRHQISCSPDFLIGLPQRRRKRRSLASQQEEMPITALALNQVGM